MNDFFPCLMYFCLCWKWNECCGLQTEGSLREILVVTLAVSFVAMSGVITVDEEWYVFFQRTQAFLSPVYFFYQLHLNLKFQALGTLNEFQKQNEG